MQFIHRHHLESLPTSDVPLEVNERVVAWMDYFSGPGADHFRRYLRRSGRYLPMMRKILKEHGMPQDLVYVALIESGFNNRAQSHASAVGPWQFISSTGRRYGLQQDTWIDERRDPVKATHAAARFLKALYQEFGHWYLAMAGYNAGEGRVRRAIADSGSKNFWVHADPDKKYLRPETRDYVPKFIAATIMAKRPELFGFGDVKYDTSLEYEVVRVPSQTDLSVIAKCVDEGRIDIEDLNPELRLSATPAGVRNYPVKIPKGTKSRFLVAYAKVPKEERVRLVMHRVSRTTKLASIARQYGISSQELARANGISRKARVHAGAELVIPVGAAYHARKGTSGSGGGGSQKLVQHKVRRGDTIGKIAHRYGVTTSDIRKWNNLNKRGMIRVGQRLKIYKHGAPSTRVASQSTETHSAPSGAATYTVRKGDTPSTIARTHGIRTKDLVAWNGLNEKRPVVKIGQKLKVEKSPPKVVVGEEPRESTTSEARATPATNATTTVHTLKSGQTLGHVAEMYGVSTKDLMRWNNIKDPKRVRAGKELVVRAPIKKQQTPVAEAEPEPDPTEASSATTATAKEANATRGGTTHTLKSGQTLGHVAEMYGVSTKDLMRWNNIKDPKRVRAGTKLVVKAPKKKEVAKASPKPKTQAEAPMTMAKETPEPAMTLAKAPAESNVATSTSATVPKATSKPTKTTYKIKSGDSLWTVARKHGVTVKEIKQWNGMGESDKIKPGQKIIIQKK